MTRASRALPLSALCCAALPLLALLATAEAARAADRASGDWGGVRTRLAEAGVEVQLDYTGESFLLDDAEEISYLGNIDASLSFDTEALGAWRGGSFFLYGQHVHGSGLSEKAGLLMAVSNYEAEPFTQISEIFLEQQLGERVLLRLGKQDANRDFASPRFAGNFVNSSFGVLPGSPLPSFPAPAIGAALLWSTTDWLGFNAGIYEGEPRIESIGETIGDDGNGFFAIGAVELRHELRGREAGVASIGGWSHTGQERSGVYGIYDVLVFHSPGNEADERSVQAFVRGGWSPEEEGEIGTYVGGGFTAHGYAGANNTIGLGYGHARTDELEETFVELFFKWRPRSWFTVEPDLQIYDTRNGSVFSGVRVELKL